MSEVKKNVRVLGLSGKAGSGKTHISNALCETLRETHPNEHVERIAFATPLKKMLAVLFDKTDKTQPIYKDKTVRYFLQTLGTEWGREKIDENFWIDMSLMKAYERVSSGYIVVEDVRFRNEADAILNLGGTVFFLELEGRTDIKESNHISETEIDFVKPKTIVIQNKMHKESEVVKEILQHL